MIIYQIVLKINNLCVQFQVRKQSLMKILCNFLILKSFLSSFKVNLQERKYIKLVKIWETLTTNISDCAKTITYMEKHVTCSSIVQTPLKWVKVTWYQMSHLGRESYRCGIATDKAQKGLLYFKHHFSLLHVALDCFRNGQIILLCIRRK